MIKVDIQKAYDSVEWPFLIQVMEGVGIPHRISNWIVQCLSTVSYTIMVNGELVEPFMAKRGLRQGDPISPYLFVLCMEYLNRCLGELRQNKRFHYHPKCKRFNITHVCFADDLLLFSRGDASSVQQMMTVLEKFGAASGLKANQLKSCIYFGGVKQAIKQEILQMTGMTEGELPFRYLGVPLASQKLNIAQYQPLIKKILSKMDCWSTRLLSYAGRVQLLKSVVAGIQLFWCQVFVIPQKVIKVLQAVCRTFLWTGRTTFSKRALIAWDKVILPKQAGGMGIGNLKMWNKAAICKLLWNVSLMKNRTWIQWIHGYYIRGRDCFSMEIPQQCSWVVRKILGAREYVQNTQEGKDLITGTCFSIKKMYHILLGDIEKVAWAKMICQNPAPAKCVFIAWLLLHGKLATCSYLEKMGITTDYNCCLCERTEENLDQLFFGCEYSKEVWRQVALHGVDYRGQYKAGMKKRDMWKLCAQTTILSKGYIDVCWLL